MGGVGVGSGVGESEGEKERVGGWGGGGGKWRRGGIRTRVPGFPDHLISSQRRYDRFGTSPEV